MTLKDLLRPALLVAASLLGACGGGGGDENTCLIPDFCEGGGGGSSSGGTSGTVTADRARLTVLGPIDPATGQRFSAGQLTLSPSSRTVGFVARLEDIRNLNNPRPLAGAGINLDVTMGETAYSRARAVVLSADGVCPASGGARGANTNAAGEILFCFIAPPTSEVPAGEDLSLALRATAFLPTTAGSTDTTAVRQSFSLIVENPENSFSLRIAGPAGEPSETLTVNAGETLNGLTATLASESGSLPNPRPFVRLVPTLGRVITPAAAGGVPNAAGVLSFGYQAGCPDLADPEETVLITANTSASGQPVEQEFSLFVQRVAATLAITLPSGTSSAFSGETVEGVRFRLSKDGGGTVTGTPVTVQAAVNGLPVGQFLNPATGDFGNPLTLPAPSSGTLLLDYETEAGLRSNQTVTLSAGASDDSQCISARAASRSLQVRTKGTGSLVVLGDSGEPSGGISLSPDQIGSLVVRALDGLGNAVPGASISFSSSPSGVGRIEIPGSPGRSTAMAGADGSLAVDYLAPASISAEQTVVLTASATIDGRDLSSSYNILLQPPPPASAPVLSLTGPGEASPGEERTGFSASLRRLDGTAVPAAQLSFGAASGAITVYENGVARPGVSSLATDAAGRVAFSYTPSSSLAATTTVALTAAVANGQPLASECSSNAAAVCSDSSNVTVQIDQFEFTAPSYGSTVVVGNRNAQALSFNWRTAAGASVPECLDLSTSFRGAGDAAFGLIIGSDPTPQTQVRRVQLNASGAFATPISVYSDRSGFLEISARENRGCAATASGPLSASTGVQFFDEVCGTTADGRNCVDLSAPVRVLSSPDTSGAQRSTALSLDIRNNAFQPIDGAAVTFTITSPASCPGALNERVFPGGGTTNANGVAVSQYFVPNFDPALAAGTSCQVQLQGCVRGQSGSDPDALFCSTRTILIQQPTP